MKHNEFDSKKCNVIELTITEHYETIEDIISLIIGVITVAITNGAWVYLQKAE